MNNKEAYKKAMDNIHASEKLKQETLEKAMNNKKTSKIKYLKTLSACAAAVIVICTVGYMNRPVKLEPGVHIAVENTEIKYNKDDELPRFSNIQDLRKALVETRQTNGLIFSEIQSVESAVTKGEAVLNDAMASVTQDASDSLNETADLRNDKDYSTTNNQVANVDEADIVKTDGDYIYYVQNNVVYVIKADTLEEVSRISLAEDKGERFYPREIFINEDKLVVLGNHYIYEYEEKKLDDEFYYDYAYSYSKSKAKAMIYSIENKKDLKLERELALDGNYVQARMIGDNVYFISRKNINYYKKIRDIEILPIVYDSTVSTNDIVISLSLISLRR